MEITAVHPPHSSAPNIVLAEDNRDSVQIKNSGGEIKKVILF